MKETIVKINKTKTWFFEKINKIDKLLARHQLKKEKNQINKIRNENGVVTTECRNTKDYETIMNNYMVIKCITWKKWTDSLKSSVF